MKLSRQSRLATVLIALASVFVMQLAAAAYACPSVSSSPAAGFAVSPVEGCDQPMPASAGTDWARSNLCHLHCHASDQSVDNSHSTPQLTHLSPLFAAAFLFVPFAFGPTKLSSVAPVFPPFFSRVIAPPLSIRNCCFRT